MGDPWFDASGEANSEAAETGCFVARRQSIRKTSSTICRIAWSLSRKGGRNRSGVLVHCIAGVLRRCINVIAESHCGKQVLVFALIMDLWSRVESAKCIPDPKSEVSNQGGMFANLQRTP